MKEGQMVQEDCAEVRIDQKIKIEEEHAHMVSNYESAGQFIIQNKKRKRQLEETQKAKNNSELDQFEGDIKIKKPYLNEIPLLDNQLPTNQQTDFNVNYFQTKQEAIIQKEQMIGQITNSDQFPIKKEYLSMSQNINENPDQMLQKKKIQIEYSADDMTSQSKEWEGHSEFKNQEINAQGNESSSQLNRNISDDNSKGDNDEQQEIMSQSQEMNKPTLSNQKARTNGSLVNSKRNQTSQNEGDKSGMHALRIRQRNSEVYELIRHRKGTKESVKVELTDFQLQKRMQFHNQLKIFMLQGTKYISHQIRTDNTYYKGDKEMIDRHVKYLTTFKNKFTKNDLSTFLKRVDPIQDMELEDIFHTPNEKNRYLKQRRIISVVTILISFLTDKQKNEIFRNSLPDEFFQQNKSSLTQYLINNKQAVSLINQHIDDINTFNHFNRIILQKFCLLISAQCACKKKASKLDQFYCKNYVLNMISHPNDIE